VGVIDAIEVIDAVQAVLLSSSIECCYQAQSSAAIKLNRVLLSSSIECCYQAQSSTIHLLSVEAVVLPASLPARDVNAFLPA
jgi:hypothetical protein